MIHKRPKVSKELEEKIDALLNLSNVDFCRHKIGKKIRKNFEDRGWLGYAPRGNPSKGGRTMWENKRRVAGGGDDF